MNTDGHRFLIPRSRDLMTLNPDGRTCVARAEQCRGGVNLLTAEPMQMELELTITPAPLPEILTLREFAEQMEAKYGNSRLLRQLQAMED